MLQTMLDLAIALCALLQAALLPTPLHNEMKILELVCRSLAFWTTDTFTNTYPKLLVFKDHWIQSNIYSKLTAIKRRFDSADPTLTASQLAKIEKSNSIRLKKYQSSLEEWPSMKNSINEHKIQLETLLDIIYPTGEERGDDEPADSFDRVLADNSNGDTHISSNPQSLLHPSGFSMTISLDAEKVRGARRLDILHLDPDAGKGIREREEENGIIFQQIRENRQVLLSLRSNLADILALSTKVIDPDEHRLEAFLKELIDAKSALKDVLEKSRIILDNAQEAEESDDEVIFEEVDESFHMSSSTAAAAASTSKGNKGKVDNSKVIPVYSFTGLKPVFSSSTTSLQNKVETDDNLSPSEQELPISTRPTSSSTKRNPLFDQAPVVEWQPDLDHWSSKRVTFADISTHSGLEFKHRFLGEATEASHDKEVGNQVIEKLRKRMVVVKDVDVESKRAQYAICGVKLKNGNLCQRRDQTKCPFHGIIKPRGPDGELLKGEEEPPRQHIWQEIEHEVLLDNPLQTHQRRGMSSRAGSAATVQIPKDSVRTRILKKSKRISSRAARSGISDGSKLVQELVTRDRQVFRW